MKTIQHKLCKRFTHIFILSWSYFDNSSTNLSTSFFLHLQFSWSKYSQTSHHLSHWHSQLLGFQINALSQTPLSINFSRLHLSSFHFYSLLQALAFSLHFHLQGSYHFMCLVSLVPDIKLKTLMFTFFYNNRNTQFKISVYWLKY